MAVARIFIYCLYNLVAVSPNARKLLEKMSEGLWARTLFLLKTTLLSDKEKKMLFDRDLLASDDLSERASLNAKGTSSLSIIGPRLLPTIKLRSTIESCSILLSLRIAWYQASLDRALHATLYRALLAIVPTIELFSTIQPCLT